jgi:sugar phosphate permease
MMIGGLCAVESSSKKVASAATGFTGTFGYIGAVLSATGTGFMLDKFGWNGALYFWIVSALICISSCVMLWKNEKKKAC